MCRKRWPYCGVLVFILGQFQLSAQMVSPLDYGLELAQTGIERYEILRKTHESALKQGLGVSYKGINRVEITIPKGAQGIPLTSTTDFSGVELIVENTNVNNCPLFVLSQEIIEVSVEKSQIVSGNFRTEKLLNSGRKLLVVEDETPWVKNRRGYDYGAMRKDVLLLENGDAQNSTIASYADNESSPHCYYCDVSGQKSIIQNLVFTRTNSSNRITRLFLIQNQNDVLVQNVVVNTPESNMYGDCAIEVRNVTNLTMEDVTINNTYSRGDKFGYGIGMNNVWNTRFIRIMGHGRWGIFGNHNISRTTIEYSCINRFDIHCYGRDFYASHTMFHDLYNQVSSFFGEFVYDKCSFIDFVPILFEASYDAYAPFDLVFRDCLIRFRANAPYLIRAGSLGAHSKDNRKELSATCWPNLVMRNVTIILPNNRCEWSLFNVSGRPSALADYIESISLDGVHVVNSAGLTSVRFSNNNSRPKNRIHLSVHDSSINNIIF